MKKFLIGASFVSIILPLANCFTALVNQGTDYLCTCIAVKTAEKQASLPQQEEESNNSQCIGFQVPTSIEYEEEE